MVSKTLVAAVVVAAGAAGAAYFAQFAQAEYVALGGAIAWLGIDEFTGSAASVSRQAQVVLTEILTGAAEFPLAQSAVDSVALEWQPSSHVSGLRVTGALGSGTPMSSVSASSALVVGTIRMGFGHHRIAYAMSSWGAESKRDVYFHDLLSIESRESRLIHETDAMYRKSSKLATEYGGPFELFHGFLTKNGDATSLRSTALIGARLAPLMRGLPRDAPVIATHTLVALAAAMANVTQTILNLVIDNHPQWFVVAPRALNLVQGPRNYYGFLKMMKGGSKKNLALAGHWIPRELVTNAAVDSERRLRRAALPAVKAPRRLLVPVGGAGAQRAFITQLVVQLAPYCHRGEVALVLNAGDHADMRDSLLATLEANGFDANDPRSLRRVSNMDEARALTAELIKSDLAAPKATLMAFTDYFAAVAATDVLVRAVDVLACKPSELAFYPVPKLMLRRVGDHEAFSANRANEIGDGTDEVRTVADALEYVQLFVGGPEPLRSMSRAIKRASADGTYDGCKNALTYAI